MTSPVATGRPVPGRTTWTFRSAGGAECGRVSAGRAPTAPDTVGRAMLPDVAADEAALDEGVADPPQAASRASAGASRTAVTRRRTGTSRDGRGRDGRCRGAASPVTS